MDRSVVSLLLPGALLGAVSAACAAPSRAEKKTAPAAKPAKAARPAAAMAWNPKELDLAPGETYRVELAVPSPTGKSTTGKLSYEPGKGVTVKPDPRWKDQVPAWGVKTFPWISAAADASGDVPVSAQLEKGGKATLMVHITSPGVDVVPGKGQVTVRVTNPFRTRTLSGRVLAANRDRFLQDITTREFKIAPGMTQDVVFPLPGAAPAETEKYDFTITVQSYQGFKHGQHYQLQFPAQ